MYYILEYLISSDSHNVSAYRLHSTVMLEPTQSKLKIKHFLKIL